MINLLFVGNSCVGKSALIDRFCKNSYSGSYLETTSVRNIKKTIEYNDSTLDLQIFDASGKPGDQQALKEYYEKVSGVFLVFSLTDRQSFNSVKTWIDILQKDLSPAIPIVLVGNKQDVGEKLVSPEDISQMTDEYKIKYYEVSAKENIKVSELFSALVHQIKSGQSGKGTPRSQLKRQDSSGTPRKLILQSLGDTSQNILTQKIQEQVSLLKAELLEAMEDQRRKESENMDTKINELREENKNLAFKVAQLEHSVGAGKASIVKSVEDHVNIEEYHEKNSVYLHDNSVHESEGKYLHGEPYHKQFEDEIAEIKRRLIETDIRVFQTLKHFDTKFAASNLALMKEVNLKAGGTLTDAELLAIGEKFNDASQSLETPPALKPKTSPHKIKQGRVKAYSNFALSVNTHGKSGSVSHRRKFSAVDGENAEPKLGQDYINSETIIRENQDSPAIPQPQATSIFIYNEEHNQDGENPLSLQTRNFSESKVDDAPHDGDFRMEEGFRNIEEEIHLIWKTINTIIENAHDQISRLKTEYSPTTNQAQNGSGQEPTSLADLKNDEIVDLLKKEYADDEPKSPTKASQEKDLKTTLIELKDDVHNQILGVQREFEKELLGLKDILMGHYQAFSGKIERENLHLRDYIDDKIDEVNVDIEKVMMNYEPEIVRSTRSMSEGKVVRSSTQSKDAGFDNIEITPVNNNADELKELKQQIEFVTETKLKEVQTMQDELGKSIWETISLMATRVAQVEQDVVTRIAQQIQKK